jgi:uncharacterized protein (TIGR02271 family)
MTTGVTQAKDWRGRDVVDSNGDKVGSIEELYCDADTREPEWAAVKTGLFGTKLSFVPITQAEPAGEEVRVPFAKDQIKDAPKVDPEGELSQQEEAELYGHYGLSYTERDSESGLPAEAGSRTRTGTADTSAGEGTGTDDAMTRSEEEVRVGTERQPAGGARLRKWVETDEVERSVPVRREQARVESEPITDDNVDQAMSGPEISESEHEVVLHEEEPVVEKRTVPKERVRLEKDVETDEEQVSEQVRKERIEAEGDV